MAETMAVGALRPKLRVRPARHELRRDPKGFAGFAGTGRRESEPLCRLPSGRSIVVDNGKRLSTLVGQRQAMDNLDCDVSLLLTGPFSRMLALAVAKQWL
jgi:hypothetical protein